MLKFFSIKISINQNKMILNTHRLLLQVNPEYLKESTVTLPVQINGKTRGTIQVEKQCTEEDAFELASSDSKLSKFLEGKAIKKRIFVPGKILNIILEAQSVKKVAQR